MARVILSLAATVQIDRCRDFYAEVSIGIRAVKTILSAFDKLAKHPAIGRPYSENLSLRELVIPFGHHGYVALYSHSPTTGIVMILAVRHQRQAGYATDEEM